MSAIDVRIRTKYPTDITVGSTPFVPLATPGGKTVFVPNYGRQRHGLDNCAETRTKDQTDIAVGSEPAAVAITPCRP
jgi:DNA-binding beta-propeller fold protein YncE